MANHVAQKKPEPAANQVWMFDGDNEQSAPPCGPCVIRAVGAADAMFTDDAAAGLDWMRSLPAWRCVGVETPAGRVMVGERREAPSGGVRVLVSFDGESFACPREGDEADPDPLRRSPDVLTFWPLLPSLAPLAAAATQAVREPDTSPRPSGCRCQWEQGDSECPVHPTCGECGCVVCECKPVARAEKVSRQTRGTWEVTATAADLKAIGDIVRAWAHPSVPDPREQRRRDVDRILAEDARCHPAFATARRCAVISAFEGAPPMPPEDLLPASHAENILRDCHRYEEHRGGMTKPSERASSWARLAGGTYAVALAVYERNRGAR